MDDGVRTGGSLGRARQRGLAGGGVVELRGGLDLDSAVAQEGDGLPYVEEKVLLVGGGVDGQAAVGERPEPGTEQDLAGGRVGVGAEGGGDAVLRIAGDGDVVGVDALLLLEAGLGAVQRRADVRTGAWSVAAVAAGAATTRVGPVPVRAAFARPGGVLRTAISTPSRPRAAMARSVARFCCSASRVASE